MSAKQADEKRSRMTFTMLTPSERERVEAQAKREGRSISSVIRRAVQQELNNALEESP